MLADYYNPYTGNSFGAFFLTLFQRLFLWLGGDHGLSLATDEVQILVLVGIALSSALVGSFLVLRRMSMLANALSHTILLGIILAYVMTRGVSLLNAHEGFRLDIGVLLIASIVTGIVTAYLTEFLTRSVRLQEEASTGLVFTSLFALGIVLVTVLTRNVHIGTEVVMGNVDALHRDDIALVYWILGINVLIVFVFFKELKITTFDSGLARSLGFSVSFFNYLLMTQIATTTVGAFRAVGVLLVLAFMTGPVLAARFLTHDLKRMIGLASVLGFCASLVGVALSRHMLSMYGLAFSTAGLVVCVIFVFFCGSLLVASRGRSGN